MSISIKIEGIEITREKLNYLINAHANQLTETMRLWAQETRKALRSKPYPPPPLGSRYKRTYQLKRRWAARKVSAGVVAISNAAASPGSSKFYARYVVGDEKGRRTNHHMSHWWIARDVIEDDYLPALIESIDELYLGLWNG